MDEFDDIRSFLASRAFVPTLDVIRRSRASGYMTLTAGDETAAFQICDGRLCRLADAGLDPLIDALTEAGVPPRKVQRARKRAQKENLRFSRVLEEDLKLGREDQGELLGRRLTDLFLDLATAEGMTHEWVEGQIDANRHPEGGDDAPASVPLSDLIVLIPEDCNDLDVLRSIHPVETEVFRARSAARELQEGELDEVAAEVIALADGERDVGEIDQASRFSSHEVLGAFHLLASQGLVTPLHADALMALASDFRRQGRLDKCLRLYLRAEQIGEPTYALAETIGGIYEMMDEGEKAVHVFATCARRALEDGRTDEATRAYEKVLSLFPQHGEAIQELQKIYRDTGNVPRAVEMLKRLAGHRASRADSSGQVEALLRIVELGHADADVIDDLAVQMVEQHGEQETVRFLQETAKSSAAAGHPEVALAALTHASRIAPKSADVALTRGHLLNETGDPDRALTELLRAIRLVKSGEDESIPPNRQIEGCEAILALDASQAETRMALVKLYRKSGRENRALEHLRALGDGETDPTVLEQIANLDPNDLDARRRLADAYREAGRQADASATLLKLAQSQARAKDHEGALSSVTEILKHDPVHVKALRTQAVVLGKLGLDVEALEARTRLFHIARWAGLFEEALDIGRELAETDAPPAEFLRAYAALIADQDPSSASSKLVSMARRAVRTDRPGLALELTEMALRRAPRSSTAKKLQQELMDTDDLSTASGLERIYKKYADERIQARSEEIEAEAAKTIRNESRRLEKESAATLAEEKQRLEEELDRRTDEASDKARAYADELVEQEKAKIDDRVAELAEEQAEELRREMEDALAEARETLAEESSVIREKHRTELAAIGEAELERRDRERDRKAEEALKKRVEELEEETELRIEERARAAEEQVLATLDERREALESEMEMKLAERLRELGEAAEKELEERQEQLATELREKAEREAAEAAERVEQELEERRAALEAEAEQSYAEREAALREEIAGELAGEKERLEKETAHALEAKTAELEEQHTSRLEARLEELAQESEASLAEAKAKLEEELQTAHDERREALEKEFSENETSLREELEQKTEDEISTRKEELETEFDERVEEKEQAARERFETKLEEETARLEEETAAELEKREAELDEKAERELAEKQQELAKQFQDALAEAKRELALALEERAKRHEEQWRDSAEKELAEQRETLDAEAKAAREETVARLEQEAEEELAAKRDALEKETQEKIDAESERLEKEIGTEAARRVEDEKREMEEEHERRLASIEADVRQQVAQATEQAKAKLREEAQREEQRLQAFYSIRHAGQPDEVKKAVEAEVEKRLIEREDTLRTSIEQEMEKKYEEELAEARRVMVKRDERAKKDPEPIRAPARPQAAPAAAAPAAPAAAPTLGQPRTKPQVAQMPAAAQAPAPAAAPAATAATPSGANRDQFISNDLIANAAAAARQVRMGGMGGGPAPAEPPTLDSEPAAPAPAAAAGGGGGIELTPPAPPKELPSNALSGIVGKLKAMKGQGLGAAPAPAAPAPEMEMATPEPPAPEMPAQEAPAPAVENAAPEAPAAEAPAEPAAEEAPAGPVDFKMLAKQSVSDIVSGLEGDG